MKQGRSYLVLICYDEESGKIYGTTKYGSFLESLEFFVKEADKVEVIPAEEHELGFRCIINNKYIGMIYHNEIFTKIEIGKPYTGYVKKVREDGLVDISLQVQGIKNLDNSQEQILKVLTEQGGKSKTHGKSSPEEIKRVFGMSKQTFKSAIGMLYKARKIVILEKSIELI